MVKYISFDVGVKNLAYCIVEFFDDKTHKIYDWGIINLMDAFEKDIHKCTVTKKGNLCGSVAVNSVCLGDNTLFFCNKKYCQSIMNTNYNKKDIKKTPKINTKTVSILDISKSLMSSLSKTKLADVDKVIIENQPVLKNPTMKSIQMVLYSFFVLKGMVETERIKDIVMFNAGRKLEVYDGPEIEIPELIKKDKYKCRKYESTVYTRYFIDNDSEMKEFFEKHKKKDDLADCYLQCLTYYKKKH